MRALNLTIWLWRCPLDIGVADTLIFDVSMELCLELMTVAYPELSVRGVVIALFIGSER